MQKKLLKKPTCHARGSAQLFGFPTNSFSIFHPPIAPPKRIRLAKNTRCRNECSDFKKIGVEHKKISSPNRPIDDEITLDTVLLHKQTPHCSAAYHQGKVQPTCSWPIAVRKQSAARCRYALAADLTRKFALAINEGLAPPNRQAKSHRATSQRVRETELHRNGRNNRDP